MSEYCFTEVCVYSGQELILQNESVAGICTVMLNSIRNAGATSLLEGSPCPLIAMASLRDSAEDTVEQTMTKVDLRMRLGIIAFG